LTGRSLAAAAPDGGPRAFALTPAVANAAGPARMRTAHEPGPTTEGEAQRPT
jgi:hypothetical protein